LQPRPAFGQRDTSADGASPASLPIRIQKDIGISVSTLFYAGLVTIGFSAWPALFDRGASLDILFHSGSTYITLGLLILLPVIYFLTRNPGELEISAQGIRVATAKSGNWFYAWSDIEDTDANTNGINLLLKGRSDEQNGFNLISAGFGIKPAELSAIIADGVKRFGAHASSQKTLAPGDDLRAARMGSAKSVLRIYGFILGGAFLAIVVWQAWVYMKNTDLQRHGRAINASVVRIYESTCGKRGCSIDVEYAFTPEPAPGNPQVEYRGYAYIADSRSPNDPDLVYARTYRTVPIVYDVDKPTISSLNFGNRILARDPASAMRISLEFFLGILAVVAVIFLAAVAPTLWKARRAAD
jgi:hypothetical protein